MWSAMYFIFEKNSACSNLPQVKLHNLYSLWDILITTWVLSHICQNRHNNSTIMVLIANLLPSNIYIVISDYKHSRKDCMHQNLKPTRMQETVVYCAWPLTTLVSPKRYKTHKTSHVYKDSSCEGWWYSLGQSHSVLKQQYKYHYLSSEGQPCLRFQHVRDHASGWVTEWPMSSVFLG